MRLNRFRNAALVFALIVGVGVLCVSFACAQRAAKKPVPLRARFVDTVWKVRASRQVAPGQLYVFLSEGTLVIASPHGKPAFGSWTYRNGALTMTEEGRAYKTEIVRLTPREFRLKIHNPGTPVEMTLVPARGAGVAQ